MKYSRKQCGKKYSRKQCGKKYSRKNMKRYRCVKLTRGNKKYKGGAEAAVPSTNNVNLPMVIDKNNVAYSCTPIPTK